MTIDSMSYFDKYREQNSVLKETTAPKIGRLNQTSYFDKFRVKDDTEKKTVTFDKPGSFLKGQYDIVPDKPDYLLTQERDVPGAIKVKIRGKDQELNVDHIVPLWVGGTNAEKNLQALSVKVHGRKTWINDDLNNPDSVINQYRTGKINLSQARVKILNWEPPETTVDFMKKPETYLQAGVDIGKGIWNWATTGIQTFIKNTGTRVGEALAYSSEDTPLGQLGLNKDAKGLEESQNKMAKLQDQLMKKFQEAKQAGDIEKARKYTEQIKNLKTTGVEDLLSQASKSTIGQITGEGLQAGLEALPFAKGLGFANRATKAVTEALKPASEALKINLIPPEILATQTWSKIGTKMLEGMGEFGAYGLGFGLSDVLQHPGMSKEEKAQVLITNTGIGVLAGGVLKPLGAAIVSRLAKENLAKFGKLTPLETQNAFQDTIKTTPIKDTGVVTTNSGIKVQTDSKVILENYIRNSLDLNYKKVKSLGVDSEGNAIQSRFEWDYKNQQGTIFTTDQTTAANLSHELGHSFDHQLSGDIQSKLSDLMPNYIANKSKIDPVFSSYAVDKLGGNATSKQIKVEVKNLADNFTRELDQLAVKRGEQRIGYSERFAAAFSEVVDNPEEASHIAPNFSSFIEYNLKASGLERGMPKADVPLTEAEKYILGKSTKFKTESGAVDSMTLAQRDQWNQMQKQKNKLLAQGYSENSNSVKQIIKAQKQLEDDVFSRRGEKFRVEQPREFKEIQIEYNETNETGKVDQKALLKINKKIFGDQDLRIVKQILTPEGQKALGSYKDAMIKIVAGKADATGTYYHEAVHKYLDKFLTLEEHARLLDYAKREFGAKTFEEAEEQLAERFIVYAKSRSGFKGEIAKLVDSVILRIKSYFGNEDTITKFYNDIVSGKAKKEVTPGAKPFSGAKITTKAFNESKFNAPDEALFLLKRVAEANDEFATSRRSATLDELKNFSKNYLGDENLYKSVPTEIRQNIGRMKAAQQSMVDMADDLRTYLASIDSLHMTDAELKIAKDKLLNLEAVTKSFAGARTEASHLFASLKTEMMPGENDILRDTVATLKGIGLDSKSLDEFIVKKNKLFKASMSDKAFSVWYASILSGPKTSARNIVSNTFHLTQEVAQKFVDPTQWQEVPAAMKGLVKGVGIGFKEAKNILKGQADLGKFIESGQQYKERPLKGKFGDILDYVGRFLNAQDKVFSNAAREMEKNSLELLRSKGKNNFTDEIIAQKAEQFAQRAVYRNKPEGTIGAIAAGIQTAIKRKPIIKIVVPFVRTVANVTDRQLDYIPIINAPRVIRAFKTGTREGHQALARAFIGVVGTASLLKYGWNIISGNGPTNYNERERLMETGWRPNSVKIGDKWYPYTYWGSMAGLLSFVGNIHDAVEYNNVEDKALSELVINGIVGWSKSVMDMSFLNGVTNIIDVVQGNITPQKYFTDLGVGLVPIPALYTQIKDMFFQTKNYIAKTAEEKLLQKLGYVKNLQPRLDIFGEQVVKDLIYGMSPSQEKSDILSNFLRDNPDIGLTMPSKTMKIYTKDGEKRVLTPQEYTEFMYLTGPKIKKWLIQKIESGYFDHHDTKEIQTKLNEIRDEAKDKMFGRQSSNLRKYKKNQD